MQSTTSRVLACLAAAVLVARPAVAVPVPPPVRGLLAVEPAPAAGDERPRSFVLAPGAAASERELAHARRQVAARLTSLDYGPARAELMASRLTHDDLAVFATHPEMLQVAGTRDIVTESYIIGGLIVAGIVILAANGSATVMVH